MIHKEEDLRDQGVEITTRLATMADRLQQTAKELEELADNLRRSSRGEGGEAGP